MKILIIRFSSFGDLVQTTGILKSLKEQRPQLEIHWLVRSDMQGAVADRLEVDKLWVFDRQSGLKGLFSLAKTLSKENFFYLYDAHASLRSMILRTYLKLSNLELKMVVRPKYRWRRFLLFKFGINTFPDPYRSMMTYWNPVKSLLNLEGDPQIIDPPTYQLAEEYKKTILLAPSAAWEMKRWPLSHFKKLIELLDTEHFIVLGGPDDTFCDELTKVAPHRVQNLAGKLTLKESTSLVAHGKMIISADTGLIHVADMMGTPGIMLTGPTAFGGNTFSHIVNLKVDLECMPCTKDGRGECSQNVYQKCMVEITPERVANTARDILAN